MNISYTALRVAYDKLGKEKALEIISLHGGFRGLKLTIIHCAIGAALREAFDFGGLSVLGEEFPEASLFILMYFPGMLDARITRVSRGEVHASCHLTNFKPEDEFFIRVDALNTIISLSLERQIYKTFLEGISYHIDQGRGDINALVVAVDCVYDAVLATCHELHEYLLLLERGRNL